MTTPPNTPGVPTDDEVRAAAAHADELFKQWQDERRAGRRGRTVWEAYRDAEDRMQRLDAAASGARPGRDQTAK